MVLFRRLAALALIYLGLGTCLHADNSIDVSPQLSQEGFLTVRWDAAPDAPKVSQNNRLIVARDAQFINLVSEISVGDQQQVHLSGFDDGTYYARLVNSLGDNLTDVVSFQVQHRSLQVALKLFFAGATLFLLLLFILFRFARKSV